MYLERIKKVSEAYLSDLERMVEDHENYGHESELKDTTEIRNEINQIRTVISDIDSFLLKQKDRDSSEFDCGVYIL